MYLKIFKNNYVLVHICTTQNNRYKFLKMIVSKQCYLIFYIPPHLTP